MASNNGISMNCSLNSPCWIRELTSLNEAFARTVVTVVVYMVMCMVVGAVGNVILLIVYSTKKNKASSDYLIIVLGCVDLMACLFIHPVMTFKLTHYYLQDWGWGCKLFEFLLHSSLAISVSLFVAIAIDRYYAVCKPLRFLKSLKLVKILLAITVLFGVIVSLPSLEFNGVRVETVESVDGRQKLQTLRCHYQYHYINSVALTANHYALMIIFAVAVALISVLYIRVAMTARRRFQGRVNPFVAGKSCNPGSSAPGSNIPTQASKRRTEPEKNIFPECMQEESSSKVRVISVACANTEVEAYTSSGNAALKSNDPPSVPLWSAKDTDSRERDDLDNVAEIDGINTSKPTGHGDVSEARETDGGREGAQNVPALSWLKLTRKTHEQTGPGTSSALRTAKMLFAVIAAFFISWSPYWVLVVLTSVDANFWTPKSGGEVMLERLLMHLLYINNSINPIIYAVFNRQFRKDSIDLLKKCLCWKN